ncbi:MAG TPA: hypothetical protein VGA77_07910 [Propylenella sp.]
MMPNTFDRIATGLSGLSAGRSIVALAVRENAKVEAPMSSAARAAFSMIPRMVSASVITAPRPLRRHPVSTRTRIRSSSTKHSISAATASMIQLHTTAKPSIGGCASSRSRGTTSA